ncbi:MAG TPA: hypothetical protein V6C95_09805 [Coleofasciculaceae cyanobacterium]
MERLSKTYPVSSTLKELTRDDLMGSVYWKLDPETFPLVISGLIRTRTDALEIFRLIVALVQHECPGLEEWLSEFNQAYQTLQLWEEYQLNQDTDVDETLVLDAARNFIKNLCNQHPDSLELYSAYNLMEGVELAWAEHYQRGQ